MGEVGLRLFVKMFVVRFVAFVFWVLVCEDEWKGVCVLAEIF